MTVRVETYIPRHLLEVRLQPAMSILLCREMRHRPARTNLLKRPPPRMVCIPGWDLSASTTGGTHNAEGSQRGRLIQDEMRQRPRADRHTTSNAVALV